MKREARLGTSIALAAVALGILGDALLRAAPGINVFLWIAAVLGGLAVVLRYHGVRLTGEGRWLLGAALGTAAAFAWRAAPMLHLVDVLVLGITFALATRTAVAGQLRRLGMGDYLRLAADSLAGVATGPLLLLWRELDWRSLKAHRSSSRLAAVGRGLLLALPLLFIFGTLLVAADAAFERFLRGLVAVDLGNMVGHVVFTGFLAWLAGGFLRTLLVSPVPAMASSPGSAPASPGSAPSSPWSELSLGGTEVATVLGALLALFSAFVAIQMRYFFGGAAWVLNAADLTFAEYARRGFFELVWVAVLVLPVLLLGDWLTRHETPVRRRRLGLLAGALVVLVFVMMASALHRMWLYQGAYGLTELRLYVTAFILWLAVVFGWFSLTVLRGRRERFAFGVLVTGYVAVALLHALNPDAVIARTNAERAAAGAQFDAHYLTRLSADAVPTVVALLPQMPVTERQVVAHRLRQRWEDAYRPDWRAWNWSRMRARQAVVQLR